MFKWLFLSLFALSLHAGVYLEKPAHFHPKPAIVGCCHLYYQDKILLLHRQDYKPEGNRWGIPSGKLNSSEDIVSAILREVREETGFQLDPSTVNQKFL